MNSNHLLDTGFKELNQILGGGIPRYSMNVISGHPGSGKTILAQHLAFNAVKLDPDLRVIYLSTLSEPTMKVLRYLQNFKFFDPDVFDKKIFYRDIGEEVKKMNLTELSDYLTNLAIKYSPAILFIDSFKALRDMVPDPIQFRKFCNDLAVELAASQCTTFLLGEYERSEMPVGAEFAIADGIFDLFLRYEDGETKRFFQVIKCRGMNADLEPHPFSISNQGILFFYIESPPISHDKDIHHVPTGIDKLDYLLGGGINRHNTCLIYGTPGSGKTTLGVQVLYEGLKRNEKAAIFSYEESPQELLYKFRLLGFDLQPFLEQQLLTIFHTNPVNIEVEKEVFHICRTLLDGNYQRVLIDSLSSLFGKVDNPVRLRERLTKIVHCSNSVDGFVLLTANQGLLQPVNQIVHQLDTSLFEGIIRLSMDITNNFQHRYLEIVKMEHSAHVNQRVRFMICEGTGINLMVIPPRPIIVDGYRTMAFKPLRTIVPENIRFGSTWLVRGNQGLGKSTLATQFAVEGLQNGESVLFISLDSPAYITRTYFESFGISVPHDRLRIMDAHPAGNESALDLEDPDYFFYTIRSVLHEMPRPARVIIDSLTPVAIHHMQNHFASFIEKKNRILRDPDIVVFDTILPQTFDQNMLYTILNNYDVVVDLYTPDWGEMGQARVGNRVLQVRKVRGNTFDNRPYPYVVIQGKGIVVNRAFYEGIAESES